VFLSASATTQRATTSLTARLADTHPSCRQHHQGGLLLLSAGRRLWSPSVLIAAARLLARRSEHIAPLLRDLHWSRVPEQIRFRPCALTYLTSKTCFHGPTRVHNPNDISIGSAVFAQLTVDGRYTLQRAALFLLKIVPSDGGSAPRVSFVVELTGNNDDVHNDASSHRSASHSVRKAL